MSYKFTFFLDMEKQVEFVEKNKSTVIKLLMNCFPSNLPNNEDKGEIEYRDYLDRILTYFSSNLIWYFALTGEGKIVGFCWQRDFNNFIYTQQPLETYRYYENDEIIDISRRTLNMGPVIESLCKDFNYKKVGSFLLKNVFEFLKNNYTIVYLVPESAFYKINFPAVTDNCIIDNRKYIEANIKLRKYYKSLGFKKSKKLYVLNFCAKQSIFYNVLYKKL